MYARTEPRRSPCALALAGALAAGALALVMLTAPAAAQAAPIGADSTRILSGGADMLSDLPIPAGRSGATGEALSDDGSVAVFSSESNGLLAGDDDSVANIYAKNLATGAVTLVSRQTGATGEPSHTNCYSPVVSGNGRYVAFVCEGSLDPADDNGRSDVYRRDLTGGTTILVSRSVDGDPGDGYSDEPSINHDGDKIAFYSRASNLVPTPTVIRGGQIYVRAVNANTTTLVSRRSGAGPAGTDDSANPSIDDAGTRVAFDSRDDSFHPTDNNGTRDVFVHDLRDGETTLVSRSDGDGAIGTHESFDPAISGDGTSIAFVSSSRFDPMADPDHDHDVYRRSLGFKTTALVSVLASGEAGNGFSAAPSISANGDRVAFVSSATNLDDLDTEESPDVYVKDLQTNTMTLMSRESFDGGAVNLDAQSTSLDRDGKRALLSTGHGSVASGTEPGFSTVMLRDTTVTPPNTIVVARPPGTEPFVNEGSRAEGGSISADGRYVAFASSARARRPGGHRSDRRAGHPHRRGTDREPGERSGRTGDGRRGLRAGDQRRRATSRLRTPAATL